MTLAAAVTLGTLFGPAQVAARVIERLFGSYYHPIWTMIAAASLMTLGLAMLTVDLPLALFAILIYGAGYGITWIARGTLPLAIFGPKDFGYRLGIIGAPARMAQAVAPLAFGLLIDVMGSRVLLVSSALSLAALAALFLVRTEKPAA